MLPKMCPSLCLWTVKVYLTGLEVLAPESPVNLCLESGPLQTKLFDLALLAPPAAPVLCLRVHEQLWPIDRGNCVNCTSQWSIISIPFMSEFEGERKAPDIRTCHHWFRSKEKKILYPYCWINVSETDCVSPLVYFLSIGLISYPWSKYMKTKHHTVWFYLKWTSNLGKKKIFTYKGHSHSLGLTY